MGLFYKEDCFVIENEDQSQEILEGKQLLKKDVGEVALSIPVNIGFIGCGNMAQALINGFLSNGSVKPVNIMVSAPSVRNLEKLKPLGINITHDNQLVVQQSHLIFLAVKPQIISEVVTRLNRLDDSRNRLFVSIAAGVTVAKIEYLLRRVVAVQRVIRVLPNTPCTVLEGCCVYSLGSHVNPSEGKVIEYLLGSLGLCEQVPEDQIDAVVGVAGSAPAYIYAVIEAISDGGVKMGLPRKLATSLAAQAVKGAGAMVLESGKHPGVLKDEVCSPAGTTIAALHVLEQHGFRNAFISAVEAAANRSKELG